MFQHFKIWYSFKYMCLGIIYEAHNTVGSWNSLVSIATGYGLDEEGSNSSPGGVKNFLFSKSSRQALGFTQPPKRWVPGAYSPGVKRPGRDADHSPPASAEVKKMWIHIAIPPYAFLT
jgi:hypothetical protein